MLHLNVRLMFYFREHLKMFKNVKEKMYFIRHLMIHLTVQYMGARAHLSVHLMMHLAIFIKMHKRKHLRLHLDCSCGCTC